VKLSHSVYDTVKRTGDIAAATLLLIVLSPLLMLLWVAVRLSLGAPAIFTQQRPGARGKIFTLYKFRSMAAGPATDTDEAAVASDAQRLSRFGRFLRSTSLDELPELWNVLVGDMSFVGPRPLLREYLDRYNSEQARRHEVRPGLTGWAQVNGRNSTSWKERLAMDVWYVDHRSLLLDAKILLKTVGTVVRREGVSAEGQATMAPFMGNDSDTADEERS